MRIRLIPSVIGALAMLAIGLSSQLSAASATPPETIESAISKDFDWEQWSALVRRPAEKRSIDDGRNSSEYFVSRESLALDRAVEEPSTPPSVRAWGDADLREDPVRVKRHWKVRLEPERAQTVIDRHLRNPDESRDAPGKSVGIWSRVLGGIDCGALCPGTQTFAGRMTKSQFVYDHALGYETTYAGSSSGGLWKIVVFGIFPIWTPVSDSLPGSPAVGDFAVGPTDARNLIIATGDYFRYGGTGIYWSADGGASWTRANTPDPVSDSFTRLRVDRSNTQRVLACGSRGVYRSTDFGRNWTRVWTGQCSDLLQDQSNASYWFIARHGGAIFESGNGGVSFGSSPVANAFGASAREVSLASPISAGNVLFALVTSQDSASVGIGFGLNGVWRSTDFGRTWVNINPTDLIGWGQGFHTRAIEVHPYDPNILVIGLAQDQFTQVAMSANPTWQIFDGGHVDFTSFRFLANSPSSTDQRIAITNDGGYFTWNWSTFATPANGAANRLGLHTTQAMALGALATSPASNAIAWHMLQDNGAVKVSHASPVRHDLIAPGDGGQVSLSPDNVDHVAFSIGLGYRRALTLNGGLSNSIIDCGLAVPSNPTVAVNPVAGLGATAPRLYTFTGPQGPSVSAQVWRRPLSTSCSTTWAPLIGSATPLPANFSPSLLEIANTASALVIYLTGRGDRRVFVLDSSLHGSPPNMSWANRTPAPPPGASGDDGAAYADRFRGDVVYYVSATSRPSRVLRSTTRGAGWTPITGNLATILPDAHYWTVVAHPTRANELYLGTSVGVYRTDDGGLTWYRYGHGMPAVTDVVSMSVNGAASPPELLVSTYGHGLWKRTMDSPEILFRHGFEP